jgi:hypothetical protein
MANIIRLNSYFHSIISFIQHLFYRINLKKLISGSGCLSWKTIRGFAEILETHARKHRKTGHNHPFNIIMCYGIPKFLPNFIT